jgi:uncharacterized membrane protein YbhN (UPF0104 family)
MRCRDELALVFEAASVTALWEVQRIALRTPSWFAVGTSQLAGNAAGNVVPGGAATSGAFAYRLLVRAGVQRDNVAAGLASVSIANTATILAFPVLALPAILGGCRPRGAHHRTRRGRTRSLSSLARVIPRPATAVGRARSTRPPDVPQQARRTAPREAPHSATRCSIIRRARSLASRGHAKPWIVISLLCCLAAVGARPNPSLVILDYSGGMLLALIPFTPGGLGFVEAGLTGLLTLAGATAHQAVVATLAYRLLTFWLPLPLGGVAYRRHRHRYGSGGASASATVP